LRTLSRLNDRRYSPLTKTRPSLLPSGQHWFALAVSLRLATFRLHSLNTRVTHPCEARWHTALSTLSRSCTNSQK
jgi:hypothetical protein